MDMDILDSRSSAQVEKYFSLYICYNLPQPLKSQVFVIFKTCQNSKWAIGDDVALADHTSPGFPDDKEVILLSFWFSHRAAGFVSPSQLGPGVKSVRS